MFLYYIVLTAPPSAPADIKVMSLECDSVKITIQPPDITGGLTVERYWIRHKLEGEDWLQEDQYISHKASTSAITVRVTKLTPEMSYYFGVCADNALGKGDFLDTGSAIVLPRKLGMYDLHLHNGEIACRRLKEYCPLPYLSETAFFKISLF